METNTVATVEYIAAQTAELARIARAHKLETLEYLLAMVVTEATNLAEVVARATNL